MDRTDISSKNALASSNWPAVLAAMACGVAVAFNIGKVPIALGEIRAEFGLSLVAAGWVASIFNTLAVLTAVFFGMLCDRVGQLRMAAIGLVLSFFAGLAALFVPDNIGLLLTRVFEGIGFLCVVVSAPGLISTAVQAADRRFALGLWGSFMPIGVGLAMVSGPLLMSFDGWRALWCLSLFGMVLSGLALFGKRHSYTTPPAVPAPQGRRFSVLRAPGSWLMALALATWSIQYSALVVWLPTFLHEQRGMPPTRIGMLAALVVLANAPGNALGGILMHRQFRCGNVVMAASLLTGVLSLAVYFDGLPDLARYACCVVLSFVGGLIPAAVFASVPELAHDQRQAGALQGLFMQGGNLGQFAGPPLIAALVAASGHWGDAIYVVAGAALAGMAFGFAYRRIEPDRQGQ